MNAYQPPEFVDEVDLDLSRNEGSPRLDSIPFDGETVARLTSRYPDTTRLTEAIAVRHDVTPDRVLVTAGGDGALFRCLLSAAGGSVVATTPGFEMIRRYASQIGLPLFEVPWWDGDFPMEEFLRVGQESSVAVVVSPNNPTGSVIGPGELRKIADGYSVVVLDAAYAEFAAEDLTETALEMDNVVVVRTLSKAFGLAGLRVGYLLGPAQVVEELRGFGSPYSVSALSAALAEIALEADAGDATPIRLGRERVAATLSEIGVETLPSQANFVLATGVDDEWLTDAAAALGVGLRRFPDRPDLSGCVRITIPGDPSDLERLEATLESVLAPQALLFDMDGVLADVSGSFRRAIVDTAARFGVEVTPGQIAAAKAKGNASDDWAVTHGLLLEAGVDVPYAEVTEVFETLYQGGLKYEEKLLVDVALLERWSQRFPLGVVTARPRKDSEGFLDRFSIAGYFSAVVTREDAASKPDPEPVLLALDRLDLPRAWMCGDTRDDITAARAAGVVPIGVAVSGDDPSALRGAARILHSVNQLEEVLDGTQV